MANSMQIKIDTSPLPEISRNAEKLRGQMQDTQRELKKLQKQLSEHLSPLASYSKVCLDEVVPVRRLRTQEMGLDQVSSILTHAAERAEKENRSLKAKAEMIQLYIAAMEIAAHAVKSIWDIIESNITKTSGCGDEQTQIESVAPTPKTSSWTYGAGDLWSVEAYPQGKYFDRNIWPNGYTRGDGCGVASTATALSSLGIQALPKDICQVNQGVTRNPVMMSWGNVAKTYGLTCNSESNLASKGWSQEQYASKIDEALNNYLNNPSGCSAPIIGFSKGYIGGAYHYVVVYGKNADGSYQIVDSSGNNMTTFNLVSGNYGMDRTNKVFNANLNQIVQFKR